MGLILVLALVLMIGFVYSLARENDTDKKAEEQLAQIEQKKEEKFIITDDRYYIKGNYITQTLSNTTWVKNPFEDIQNELNNYYAILRQSGIDFEIANITTEVIKKDGLFDVTLQKAFATVTIKIL